MISFESFIVRPVIAIVVAKKRAFLLDFFR